MTQEEVLKYYFENKPSYEKLAKNLKEAIGSFLDNENISYHSISTRIKEFDSYFEKIERKSYDKPFEQIEDFCGLRVICFFQYDLEKIEKIILNEFEVTYSIDKTAQLEPDRFGYRSNHYIVKIKKEWSDAPNYRGLENLKTEIQVRTILMHSWADIEHKLAYKTKQDIPLQFRRNLYQLSALLEIADSQFQFLKIQKDDLQKSLVTINKGKEEFKFTDELNMDTLQTYLDVSFNDRIRKIVNTRRLLDELISYDISIKEIHRIKVYIGENLSKIESDILNNGDFSDSPDNLSQVGIVRLMLDVGSEIYWNKRKSELSKNRKLVGIIQKWQREINLINISK